MSDNPTPQPTKPAKERKIKFHALLKDGTVIQHWSQKEFEANVSKHPPGEIRFAVRGDELKPHAETRVSFSPA